MIFDGKTKFQRGNNRNNAGKCLNSNIAGKQIFLAGHPRTLAGHCFSGVVTWDMFANFS